MSDSSSIQQLVQQLAPRNKPLAEFLAKVLEADGALASVLPNYSPREQQVQLVHYIAASIDQGSHLVGEGPCGVGKSVAYLVPAIYHAIQTSDRVVVATANIALQHQLVEKDLPMLKRALPLNFSYSLMKGRGNYLCHRELTELKSKDLFRYRMDSADRASVKRLLKWAEITETGDKEELSEGIDDAIWRMVSVSSEECDGKACEYYERCFTERAKLRAKNSLVIVTNYHLLFADMSIRMKLGKEEAIIPNYDIVIGDEAHKMADIARAFFGFTLGPRSISIVTKNLEKHHFTHEADHIKSLSKDYFEMVQRYFNSGRYKTKLREPLGETVVGETAKQLEASLKIAAAHLEPAEDDHEEDAPLRRRRAKFIKEVSGRVRHFTYLFDKNLISWINVSKKGYLTLEAQPYRIEGLVNRPLFQDNKSVVLVSATMTAQGSFDFITDQVGVTNDPRLGRLVVHSPFDHEKQAILVIPHDTPNPKTTAWDTYAQYVAKAVAWMALVLEGKTLGLFTSHKMLNFVTEYLRRSLAGSGIKVLKQGDMSKVKLVDTFKTSNAVLLGTESLWQGIDVPGDALTGVLIDKLPFATPDDPISATVTELNSDWFIRYSVPKATLMLKQGIGRLIRTHNDRGALVVLDPRLVDTSWGKRILNSLERMTLSRSLADIAPFIDNFDTHYRKDSNNGE
jgi:ATP-dependent DNA helicase DinG